MAPKKFKFWRQTYDFTIKHKIRIVPSYDSWTLVSTLPGQKSLPGPSVVSMKLNYPKYSWYGRGRGGHTYNDVFSYAFGTNYANYLIKWSFERNSQT